MSYAIVLEDEQGQRLDEIKGATQALDPLLAELSREDFPNLSALDRYGDTTFNRLQAARLLEEIPLLESQAGDPVARHLLSEVGRLAVRCRDDGPNVYLKFYGD